MLPLKELYAGIRNALRSPDQNREKRGSIAVRRNGRNLVKHMIARVDNVQNWLEHACRAKFRFDEFARLSGMSKRSLRRHFANHLGLSVSEWFQSERYSCAVWLLQDWPLKIVIDHLGFKHAGDLSRGLRRFFGVGVISLRKNT